MGHSGTAWCTSSFAILMRAKEAVPDSRLLGKVDARLGMVRVVVLDAQLDAKSTRKPRAEGEARGAPGRPTVPHHLHDLDVCVRDDQLGCRERTAEGRASEDCLSAEGRQ